MNAFAVHNFGCAVCMYVGSRIIWKEILPAILPPVLSHLLLSLRFSMCRPPCCPSRRSSCYGRLHGRCCTPSAGQGHRRPFGAGMSSSLAPASLPCFNPIAALLYKMCAHERRARSGVRRVSKPNKRIYMHRTFDQ